MIYVGSDFTTTPLSATIPARATNTTVKITIKNDNIVEGDEMFTMSLNVPSSLAPGVVAGSVTNATGVITDSSRIRVRFTQTQYTGMESMRSMLVTLELVGGVSSYPFNVTVTPSQQSEVSAEGNSVMCMIMCWVKSVWLTGDVDFNTTPLTATFDSGMTMSSVSVPVMDDMLVEGRDETFDLMLSSSLGPAITVDGEHVTATGVIIDTTSE